MRAYPEVYRDDVVETQGKLFDYVAQSFPGKSTEDFITVYMASKTRKSIDEAIPSAEVIAKVPLDFLKKAYFGLHDLDLELAVRKVGEE